MKIRDKRPTNIAGQKTVALGIRFEEMSPKLGGLLVAFADMLSAER